MSLHDWDGTRALEMLRERMNRLFEDRERRGGATVEEVFQPPTDVYATDDRVVVTIELPGIPAGAFQVEESAGVLSVRGERRFRGDGPSYHRLERSYGQFLCQVTLPEGVRVDARTSQLEDGVLTIEIPEERMTAEPKDSPQAPLPEVDFGTFLLSLASSVLVHLGELEHPESPEAHRNLPLAKQTLDILAMMQDKTRGNLTEEERQLLENLLYDLRMKYVAAKNR